MAAMAIFTCRQNSHPFQERHVSLHESVKIGRSVARARPAPNNVIFDCKVLSRNHALLWYEGGKFFLQDTKSSNGTFINNQRLSKGSEESPPREIWSGDIVQFGVDVMENSRRVTHGCIVSCITLFYPDGTEAKNEGQVDLPEGTSVHSQQLYQLSQYLQEALHREQMLEQKLATLQRLVSSTQEASESGWQALIDEDRLLSRLECLENQLHTYAKNQSEDTLRQELVALHEDKSNYEITAKESLKQVLEEKLEAIRKVADVEQSLSNSEDECVHLKELCEVTQKELQQLADKHDDKIKEMLELQEKLQEAEKSHKEELERTEQEKDELHGKIEEMRKQEEFLLAKVESLQADNDFTKEQLGSVKSRLELMKEGSLDEKEGADREIITTTLVTRDSNKEQSTIQELQEKLQDTQRQMEEYERQLKQSYDRLAASEEKIIILQSQLEQAQFEVVQNITKVASLEVQLQESHKQTKMGSGLAEELQDRVSDLEFELSDYKTRLEKLSPMIKVEKVEEVNHVGYSDTDTLKAPLDKAGMSKGLQEHYEQEIETLKDSLEEASSEHKISQDEVESLQKQLKSSLLTVSMSEEMMQSLKAQLEEAEQNVKTKTDRANQLQDQLNKTESTTQEVKQQILVLRDQILTEQEQTKLLQEGKLLLSKKLEKAVDAEMKSSEEASILRGTIQQMEDELERTHHEINTQTEPQEPDDKNTDEFTTLKEECGSLKERIQAIENEMKTTRKENAHLQSEYTCLQSSYSELQALNVRLENSKETCQLNVTDAQKEAEQIQLQLNEAHTDLATCQETCAQHCQELTSLKEDFNDVNEEFQQLADRSRVLCVCSSVPLLALLFAILIAFYPTLAQITATQT